MDGNTLIMKNTELRTKCKERNGFTLVEVMIAMVVLLIGMLGVMGMQYYAVSGNAVAREMRIATNYSQGVIEQIKGTPYANLASGTDPAALPVAPEISGAMLNITRRWWVVQNCTELQGNGDTCAAAAVPPCSTNPDGAAVPDVSAVRARTCWNDTNGTNHSVTLDTIRWNN